MVAIGYANREPVADLHRLLDHVHEHARELAIDDSRIGVLAASGNAPAALTTMLRGSRRPPACAAFCCGCLLDLDGRTEVATAARQFGFVNPMEGGSVADLRADVPMLITRAGRDEFPAASVSIDAFVVHALRENLPISVVNYPEGPHAYDLFDDSRASQVVVRKTLSFLAHHLA
jgi:hypothetical protein